MTNPLNDVYVVGVDFGTLSGRALVVRASDGTEVGSADYRYPHGVMSEKLAGTDVALPPDWALQHPSDFVNVLRHAVPTAVARSGIDPVQIVGIATDFTACTMIPVLEDGTPVCEVPGFESNPHAYVKLWKHHAAQGQADRINALAQSRGEEWLSRYGGRISAEWQFAKGLELFEEAPEVYEQTHSWVEAADWIVWQLSGTHVRNACTAGYKGILQDGAYPTPDYLEALSAGFGDFARSKLNGPFAQLGGAAGRLTAQAARWTGLREGTVVATGNVDAHVTAPAAQAVAPGQMVAIMGTSTCHVMNGDHLAQVPGICGVVNGGIIDGWWGYEAGQSGVGDIFAWWSDGFVPDNYQREATRQGVSIHDLLTGLAARQPVGGHGLVALDWQNGNRSVLVDHDLSGVLVGMTMASRPEDVYRALMEGTAFGTRTIIESFTQAGVPVEEVVIAGGLIKNRFLMQLYSDVLRMPLSIIGSDQGPALGSAIHAAVAAGLYPDVAVASNAMGKVQRSAYQPDPARANAYDLLYAEYQVLHDYFGRGGNDVLRRLRRIRREAAAT